jgi:hypothetical protein
MDKFVTGANYTILCMLNWNQAEQGGTGGSGPQFIIRISSYSQLFSS